MRLDAGARAARPVFRLGREVGRRDGEHRRGLGQPVDLDEVPAELRLEPLDERGRRRRAGDGEARASCGSRASPCRDSRGSRAAPPAPCRRRSRPRCSISSKIFAPSIARRTTCVPPMPVSAYTPPQPLQWNIGSVHSSTSSCATPQVGDEVVRVDVAVAVREHHALRPRRRARRVVDRDDVVLVARRPAAARRRTRARRARPSPVQPVGVAPSSLATIQLRDGLQAAAGSRRRPSCTRGRPARP